MCVVNHDAVSEIVIRFAQTQSSGNGCSKLHQFENEFPFVAPLLKFANTKNLLRERMEAAMGLGRLELVRQVDKYGGVVYTEKALNIAASRGHLNCLRHALNKVQSTEFVRTDYFSEGALVSSNFYDQICCAGPTQRHFKMPNCREHYRAVSVVKLVRVAELHGQLECAKCLRAVRSSMFYCYSLSVPSSAINQEPLYSLQYLHEHGYRFDYHTAVAAARLGSLGCLRYYRQHGGRWHCTVLQVAALHGHLSCLQYVFERGCPLYLPFGQYSDCILYPLGLIKLAELGGHDDCVKYLISCRYRYYK